jgi:hypothetical protein
MGIHAQPTRNPEGKVLEFRVADLAKAEEVFAAIREVEGVAKKAVDDVGLIMRGAKHPLARSMAFARLDGTVEPALVRAKVADIPGVLDCEVSATRGLE